MVKILVLPGDGIGPEITDATLAVLDRVNAKLKLGLEWQVQDIDRPDHPQDAGLDTASGRHGSRA